MREKYKKSLEIFAKYLNETSKEEIEKDFAEIEHMKFEGPTLAEVECLLTQEHTYMELETEVHAPTIEIDNVIIFNQTIGDEIIIKSIAINSDFSNAPINTKFSQVISMNIVKIGIAA